MRILLKMKDNNKVEEAMKDDLLELSKEIDGSEDNYESKQKELDEMKDLLLRTQANFDNFRKQSEKRAEEERKMVAKTLILDILPVMDNFELALKNVDTTTNNIEDFLKGVELIYSQLFSVLRDYGITVVESEGKEFDPIIHEALIKVESNLPENFVVEEFQKGYMLNGKIIRTAKVKVSSGKKK